MDSTQHDLGGDTAEMSQPLTHSWLSSTLSVCHEWGGDSGTKGGGWGGVCGGEQTGPWGVDFD